MLDISLQDDTPKSRFAQMVQGENGVDLHPIMLNLQINNVIPLLLVDDDTVKTGARFTNNVDPLPLDHTEIMLVDPGYFSTTGVKRFVYFATITSCISNNNLVLFYDRKYKDILVLPSLTAYKNADGVIAKDLILAVSADVIANVPSSTVPAEELHSKVSFSRKESLPETRSNLGTTTTLITTNGNDDDAMQRKAKLNIQYPNVNTEVYRGDLYPVNLIKLGKVGDIFTENDVSAALVFQISTEKHRYIQLGKCDTKERNLYIVLHF
jgi:hypothetical protein